MSGLEPPDDATLVAAARRGDREAFSSLVRRYRRPAYLAALAVVGVHEAAEDAAQEAFLVALDRIEECRDPSRFGGWFLTIVRNRAHNLVRREKVRDSGEFPPGLASGEPTPEDWAERVELRERLARAMEGLSTEQREIVLLHDLLGWRGREIAERLGVAHGTVRAHLHHARRRLRELLGDAATDERGLDRERTG